MIPRAVIQRWISIIFAALLVVGYGFAVVPQFDLRFSAQFYDAELGFWLAKNVALETYRQLVWTICNLVLLGALVMLLVNQIGRRFQVFTTRALGFVVGVCVMGPGLIVNGGFKAFWGRARPRDVSEFGGELAYAPPLDPVADCLRNCSFVSGEASAVATVAMLAILLIVPFVRGWGRGAVIAGSVFFALSGSFLRVLFGGHFLSDVIFANLLMALLVLLAYLALGMDRHSALARKP